MIKSIIQAPDYRLRILAKSFPDDPFPDDLEMKHKEVLRDLLDTFEVTIDCIGLAATQIDHQWRAIIIDITPSRSETFLMMNPIIIKASEDLQRVNDGCVSINNGRRHDYTHRPKRITVEWVDVIGNKRQQKFHGLHAAVIHHEIDHLDGVLFTDRITARSERRVIK